MKLMQGDCVEAMRSMPEDSVDAVVCDPPAGISFMSKSWDGDKGGRRQWVAWFTEVMEEALRVAKPGAHAFVWALPRTSHWTAWALEDAGWEIRDVCHHIFGSGFPKSLDVSKAIDKMAGAEREVVGLNSVGGGNASSGFKNDWPSQGNGSDGADITTSTTEAAKQWEGFGTALKPAVENWILCRKPLSEKSVARNVLEHGTGALNIGSARIASSDQLARRSLRGPYQSERTWNVSKTPGRKNEEPSGRWPANALFSHSPECQRVGVKRVKPGNGSGNTGKRTGRRGVYEDGLEALGEPWGTYNDPDGFEEVEAWECVMGCPVAELDRQSGTLKSGGKKNASYSNENDGVFTPGGKQTSSFYGSEGGASRFFKTFEGEQDGMSEPSVCTHPDCTVELHLANRCLGTEGAQVTFEGGSNERVGRKTRTLDNNANNGGSGSSGSRALVSDYGLATNLEGEPGFRYQAKASRSERNAFTKSLPRTKNKRKRYQQDKSGRWYKRVSNNHPTVKPLAPMRYLVKLVTPPGGVVLDPFAGSGSTLVAAIQEGFEAVGIEQDASYIEIAERRVAHALEEQEQKPLLLEV